MIISQTPLRISLGGGGTDLPSYYTQDDGFLISAAIDKYVYISLHENFKDDIIAHYSKSERVDNIDDLKHPLIREALKLTGVTKRIEVASMADIPAGTGLGSSGSFTVGLLNALHHYKREKILTKNLAEEACHIEMDILKEPVGKQDQYIAAFGGITSFTFKSNGNVEINQLKLSPDIVNELENNLLLFFTSQTRSASAILKDQDDKSKSADSHMIENLKKTKELGIKCGKAIESGNLRELGELFDVHWKNKRTRTEGMSNPEIDKWYDIAIKNGAIGGKLVGAGGGGFLMFCTEDAGKLRSAMKKEGLHEVKFKFDFEGSKILVGN
ncbi:MAG: galactokinase [archaeon]